jgi:hypothetical protein
MIGKIIVCILVSIIGGSIMFAGNYFIKGSLGLESTDMIILTIINCFILFTGDDY